jgi:hypothetical protein
MRANTSSTKQFAAKITQAELMVPDWASDFAFHPMGFDLNGAWGPSALCIPDFAVALSSVHDGTSSPPLAPLFPSHFLDDLADE